MPASAASRPDWGWHALADSWARRIVTAADIHTGDLVLDIGAGTGAFTRALLRSGARVVAVELHPGRAALLRRTFDPAEVTVVQADAADLRLPRGPFRVVGSPPFGISTTLLTRLLSNGSRMVSADLVLQRAVTRRYADGHGRGAARWSRTWTAEMGRAVPRSAFTPPPRVDCSVLTIRSR